MYELERAIGIAAKAHAGQVDKAQAPYILHVLRVVQGVDEYNEKVVAALHDVVEDTQITIDYLREKGLVRTEGKEYIVKDGDVIEFKI